MRLLPLLAVLVLVAGFATSAPEKEEAAKPTTLDVWPGKAPGEPGNLNVGEEKFQEPKAGETKPVKRLTNVTKPTLTVFKAPKDKDTGAAVLICPGGGYNILAWDLEGEEVAKWLNGIGVTGIVLKYRVPKRPDQAPHLLPQMDAQRAMSLVRGKARDWGLDDKRIGILGFSAGGHLSAVTSNNFDKRGYEPIDDVDKQSCRPDFAVLVYPAYLVEKDKDQLTPEMRITEKTPPTFLAHAGNDGVKADNSIFYYLALKKAGVPAELHVYNTGGHGFGLRPSEHPCSTWPQRCEEWMKSRGLLKKASAE